VITLPPSGFTKRKGAIAPVFVSLTSSVLGTGNNTVVMTKPAGVTSGDLMVFIFWSNGTPTVTQPGGWTVPYDATATLEGRNHRYYVAYKRAGAGEAASYTWTLGGGSDAKGGVLLAYRPSGSTQLDLSVVQNPVGTTSATHAMATSSTTYANSTLVYAWLFQRVGNSAVGSIAVAPSGMTQRYYADHAAASDADAAIAVYDEIRTAAGAVGVKTLTTTNSDISSMGVRLALRGS